MMKSKQSQKHKLKQKLIPYLAFRAKIMEMNLQNLNEFITNMLETNPFTEEDRTAPAEMENWREYISSDEDMYESLIHQFRMIETDEREKEIGEYIINSLNKEGYFLVPIKKVAEKFNVPTKYVENVLKKVQSLDPPGIAARNLPECFVLQLENESTLSPKIKHVILHHLQELADEKFKEISKETELNVKTLKTLKEKISHLTAAPGYAFQKEKIKYTIPDIVIKEVDGKFLVELNKKFRRNFHINKKYIEMIKGEDSSLKELADRARWTKQSIEERDALLLSIGKFIAEKEKDFLKKAVRFPTKHSLDEIAKELNSNVSVISRLVQNKYIETPIGIFPLRFFIQHKGRSFNDEEVKTAIKEIIKGEDKSKPYSDDDIARILRAKGIDIKRRTIVKYRKMLGIPSSTKRKRVD